MYLSIFILLLKKSFGNSVGFSIWQAILHLKSEFLLNSVAMEKSLQVFADDFPPITTIPSTSVQSCLREFCRSVVAGQIVFKIWIFGNFSQLVYSDEVQDFS